MVSNNGLDTVINAVIGCSAILGNGLVIFVMTVRRDQFSSFTNRLIRHQPIIDFISGLVFLLVTGIKQSSLFEEVEDNFVGVFLFFNVAIGCSAILGNGLVIFVMTVRRKQFTSFTNRLIRHQSIIDFISSLVFLLMTGIKQTSLLENVERNSLSNGTVNQQADGVLSKAKRNVILTMLIAGIMFFICWTPLEMMRFLVTLGITREPNELTRTILTGLVMCNMSVNPVVYCFKYQHFRTQLKQLVRSRFGRNRVRPGEESNGTSLAVLPIQQTATASVS
ncbi:uncharacterized protein LOC117288103 [Asterias rubens]|uniref:uncharacterized protein LOC117288103 n=1 Tax=Asterias rubens TaxID=7604 RepID=UPI0014555F7E|nr:uncharacterized protein LOC117288103 [Asterias rubens]